MGIKKAMVGVGPVGTFPRILSLLRVVFRYSETIFRALAVTCQFLANTSSFKQVSRFFLFNYDVHSCSLIIS